MKPTVTLVTSRAASADELSDADYRDIYDELRSKCTLRQFVELMGERESCIAWWSKYERRLAHLDRERQEKLRRAVGLPELPPAVAEVTAGVSQDARVWQVGDGIPDRLVMVGAETHEPLTLRLNGSLRILDEELGQGDAVTGVTRPRDRSNYAGLSVRRDTKKRLNAARLRAGKTWDEFLAYWASLLEEPEDLQGEEVQPA